MTCETDCWSKRPDIKCSIVASIMNRTRLQLMKSYLHTTDNQNLSEFKMVKMPLCQIFNKKL